MHDIRSEYTLSVVLTIVRSAVVAVVVVVYQGFPVPWETTITPRTPRCAGIIQ